MIPYRASVSFTNPHCLTLEIDVMSRCCCLLAVGSIGLAALAQPTAIPTPESVIGHPVGADYKLAKWDTVVEYYEQLGAASDRVNVRVLDEKTTEGNDYLVVEIGSADTLRQIDKYKAYQARLSDPRLLGSKQEIGETLANAKTTILVSCGLHSSEVAATQMSMELAYELASRDDDEVREILDNCLVVLIPSANPDGLDKIVDWYERNVGTPFEGAPMPWLYQKYAGHDNNRDWFMLNLVETRILTNLLYFEYHPTILHDVHQMGNRGARFFVPPFFDPVNPNVDPLIHQSLLLIGGHMATRLQEEGKTGVVFKAIFDNWWQGGNRTTPYRHNITGILTECASAKYASPIFQEYGDLSGGGRGFPEYAPAVNFPEPWAGGWWRLRDAVEYQKSANFALFQLAARYRDRFVANHHALSLKAVSRGALPADTEHANAAARRAGTEARRHEGDHGPPTRAITREPEPPYAWLVPPDQRDPGAATHMLEILRLSGIEIHKAKAAFAADGVDYPAGTYVLLAAQPFRPHLKDMMERQEYPQRRVYPGGPAESPYDVAGWTLPLQMGVKSVEVVGGFEADLETLSAIPAAPRQGRNHVRAVFKSKLPGKVGEPRTALYQPWTSSMDEGWTRLVLEEFDFPYTTVHNAEIRAGDLNARFDCIIIADISARSLIDGRKDTEVPAPYAGGIGDDGAMQLERFVRAGGTLVLMDSATELATDVYRLPVRNVLKDVPRDKFFCPGSLLRIRVDHTQPLGYGFDDEAAAYFAGSQAFVVGEAALRHEGAEARRHEGEGARAQGAGRGEARGSEDPSDLRELSKGEIEKRVAEYPVTTIARYSDNIVLLSGYLLGEEYLRDEAAVCEVKMGAGQVVLFGFRVQHRGQPWGTFKFLFNAIYRSALEAWPRYSLR
jgi:hypothetical protein